MFPFAGNNGLFSIWSTIVLSRALDAHPCLTNTGPDITPGPGPTRPDRQLQTCRSSSRVEGRVDGRCLHWEAEKIPASSLAAGLAAAAPDLLLSQMFFGQTSSSNTQGLLVRT